MRSGGRRRALPTGRVRGEARHEGPSFGSACGARERAHGRALCLRGGLGDRPGRRPRHARPQLRRARRRPQELRSRRHQSGRHGDPARRQVRRGRHLRGGGRHAGRHRHLRDPRALRRRRHAGRQLRHWRLDAGLPRQRVCRYRHGRGLRRGPFAQQRRIRDERRHWGLADTADALHGGRTARHVVRRERPAHGDYAVWRQWVSAAASARRPTGWQVARRLHSRDQPQGRHRRALAEFGRVCGQLVRRRRRRRLRHRRRQRRPAGLHGAGPRRRPSGRGRSPGDRWRAPAPRARRQPGSVVRHGRHGRRIGASGVARGAGHRSASRRRLRDTQRRCE